MIRCFFFLVFSMLCVLMFLIDYFTDLRFYLLFMIALYSKLFNLLL